VALAKTHPEVAGFLDDAATLPEAEVAYVIREELPKTLIDVVYRRMMIGLDANMGRPHYARIAELAAAEFAWDDARRDAELHALRLHTDSLHVGRPEVKKLTS
jgi:glycerol-3-phosphate dehydrogenase